MMAGGAALAASSAAALCGRRFPTPPTRAGVSLHAAALAVPSSGLELGGQAHDNNSLSSLLLVNDDEGARTSALEECLVSAILVLQSAGRKKSKGLMLRIDVLLDQLAEDGDDSVAEWVAAEWALEHADTVAEATAPGVIGFDQADASRTVYIFGSGSSFVEGDGTTYSPSGSPTGSGEVTETLTSGSISVQGLTVSITGETEREYTIVVVL